MNKEASQLLGLALRARKLALGEGVLTAVRGKQAYLVLYTSDASENTKKQITDKCKFYGVEALEVEDSLILSQAIGKTDRKSVAILDAGFARKIKEKLGVGDMNG